VAELITCLIDLFHTSSRFASTPFRLLHPLTFSHSHTFTLTHTSPFLFSLSLSLSLLSLLPLYPRLGYGSPSPHPSFYRFHFLQTFWFPPPGSHLSLSLPELQVQPVSPVLNNSINVLGLQCPFLIGIQRFEWNEDQSERGQRTLAPIFI